MLGKLLRLAVPFSPHIHSFSILLILSPTTHLSVESENQIHICSVNKFHNMLFAEMDSKCINVSKWLERNYCHPAGRNRSAFIKRRSQVANGRKGSKVNRFFFWQYYCYFRINFIEWDGPKCRFSFCQVLWINRHSLQFWCAPLSHHRFTNKWRCVNTFYGMACKHWNETLCFHSLHSDSPSKASNGSHTL